MEAWELDGWDPEANRRLGYRNYLKSNAWQRVRRAVLHRSGGRCEGPGCRRSDQDANEWIFPVHHKTDAHRYDELRHLEDLLWLCKACHAQHHPWLDRDPEVRKSRIYSIDDDEDPRSTAACECDAGEGDSADEGCPFDADDPAGDEDDGITEEEVEDGDASENDESDDDE